MQSLFGPSIEILSVIIFAQKMYLLKGMRFIYSKVKKITANPDKDYDYNYNTA